MKKRVMSVLIAITMLAGMGTMASAASVQTSVQNQPIQSVIVNEETGDVFAESPEEFMEILDFENVSYSIAYYFYFEYTELLEDPEAYEYYEAYLQDQGITVNSIDEMVDALWESEEGEDYFFMLLSELVEKEITADNFDEDEVQLLLYINGINTYVDINGDTYEIGVDSSLEEVTDFVYNEMYFGEASTESTTAAEEDTTAAEEDTTAAEEDTTAAEEDTTAAEEDTTAAEEDTTAAEEDTTVEEDTTASTTAKDNSQNPNTGDPSMLLYGALAAVGGLGALATKKRK